MINTKKYVLSLLLGLCYIPILFSQFHTIKLKQLSVDQGLPGVSVQVILQNSQGLVWIGVESEGLCKYDGHNFFLYEHDMHDSTTISNNFVTSIYEDTKGNLWVGTRFGLNYFNRENDRFIHYYHNPADTNSLSHNYIEDIVCDRYGNLWIATQNGITKFSLQTNRMHRYLNQRKPNERKIKFYDLFIDSNHILWAGARNNGLYKISIKRTEEEFSDQEGDEVVIRNWRNNKKDANSLANNDVMSIIEDQPGILFLGTARGIDKFTIQQNAFEHIRFFKNGIEYVKDFSYTKLFKDNGGIIWAATTNNGLLLLHSKTFEFTHIESDPIQPYGLKSNLLREIIMDQTGLIWIGTKFEGIQIYNKRQEVFPILQRLPEENAGLSSNDVTTIVQDSKGVFWIGSKDEGLSCYNKETGKFKHFKKDKNNPFSIHNNRVEDIVEGESNNLWIGTENGLEYFDKETERFYHYGRYHHRAVLLDNKNQLWMGTLNGIFKFDEKRRKFIKHKSKHNFFSDENSIVYKIYQDKSGNLWFATYHDGIYEYNMDKDSITHFYNDIHNPESLSGDIVRAVYEDRKGRIWIGTISDGLNKYDRINKKFIHISSIDGLPSNTVYAILEDAEGNLWLSTHNGLSKFDPENMEFENYNLEYGLQGKVFAVQAACLAKDGEMYFGGYNGINHFYPQNIQKETYEASMVISSVKVFDKEIYHDVIDFKEIKLNHTDNYITIEFSLLDYSDPLKNAYAYKLEGFDEEWIECGNRNFVSYTNLPPGAYTFQARGANADGIWHDGVSCKLIILQPLWKRWWFLVIAGAILLSIILFIYYIRIYTNWRKQKQLEREIVKKTEELQEAYNVLTKQKKEIEIRNEQLTLQSEQIRYQNTELEHHRSLLEWLVKKRTKELVSARKKAEESDHLKSAFLANMSHEIRTPLNALVGFSEILANEKLSKEEIQTYNKIIQENSMSLLQVINDILDISKIESEQIEIRNTEINLYEFIYGIYLNFKELASERDNDKNTQVELKYIHPAKGAKDIFLYTDKSRLKQIFDNLMSNAIKNTEKGSIEIGFKHKVKDNSVLLYVKDTGVGIDKKYFDSIFTRYSKINDVPEEQYTGVGIGLSITKNLVELLGGRIWVESELGKGSTFYFELPLHKIDKPVFRDKGKTPDWKRGKPEWEDKSILVIEDEESNYLVLETFLKPTKAKILWAKDGEEGIQKYKSNKDIIDLVLVDIELPKMKGTEVIKHIKQLNKKVPVIAQTAYAMQEEEEEIMKTGFDDYMAKPLLVEKVYSILSLYIGY